MDQVEATKGSRKQATLLVEIWRDASVMCVERVKRKALGESSEDLEVPLPEDVATRLHASFEQAYAFSLNEHEVLWSHMLGRIRREIEKKTHSLIRLERCGSEREGGRSSAAKRLKWGSSDVTLSFAADQPSKDRDINSNFVYVSLLRILMEGGYAVAGCTVVPGTEKRFAHLQGCRDYVSYVAIRATPLSGKWPPIERVRRSDEDTRALWASHMRKGASLSEAMELSAQKMEAFWLWTAQDQVETARVTVPHLDESFWDVPNDAQSMGHRAEQLPPAVGQPRRSGLQQQSAFPKGGKHGQKGQGKGQSSSTGQVAQKTRRGHLICAAWNKGQCSNGRCQQSPQGLHVCNVMVDGHACSQNNHKASQHSKFASGR